MNNTETSPLGAESKNFFSKLTSGDFGLAKTYWLFGVVVGIVLNLIIKFTPSIGGLLVILALAVVYQVMVLLGVWRAANRYQGRKAWDNPRETCSRTWMAGCVSQPRRTR